MILLWGTGADEPLAAVRAELEQLGALWVLVDQRDALETRIDLVVDDSVTGTLCAPGAAIDLETVTAAYIRPGDVRLVPRIAAAGPRSPELAHAVAVEDTLLTWLELTPARVVNRISTMATNGSKPYQIERIRALGFAVPETLVTTDPAAVADFQRRYGSLIYKSVSGVRSKVSRLTPDKAAHVADVRFCPTQFQQHIPGTDHRVHVVGRQVFACELLSDADDYRYPADPEHAPRIQAVELPSDVEEGCRRLTLGLQLPVAGIDLRRTPEGAWYCFEVNPSPGFSFFEQQSGAPIASAIAGLLTSSA